MTIPLFRPRILLATAAAALLVPPTAKAQARRLISDTTSVPIALAEALLGTPYAMLAAMMSGGQSRPHIVVGKLPTTLEQQFWLPPNSTVLGGVDERGFSIAVLETSLSPDSVMSLFRGELPKRGWALPKAQNSYAPGGFRPNPGSPNAPTGDGLSLCAPGSTLSVGAGAVGLETQVVVMRLGMETDQCRPQPAQIDYGGMPRFPSLRNPPGTGSGFGSECQQQRANRVGGTTLVGVSDLGQVLDAYGKQLADSGFTPKLIKSEQRTWVRPDSTGTPTELTLTAKLISTNPNCIEIWMDFKGPRR